MLDNLREWISDNLRYILLGFAAVLIFIIAFLTIRLISGGGSPKEKEPETQKMTEQVTEADTTTDNKLVKEAADSALQQLVTQYYTAVAARDYDTLTSICESFTDEDKAKIEADAAIESYSNITTYSKKGLKDGEYIAYPYFDAKITGIDTLSPRLDEIYVVTGTEGKLVIGEMDASQELADYIAERETDADVQALVKDVNALIAKAQEEDPALAEYVAHVNSLNSGGQSNTSQDGTGTAGAGDGTGTSGADGGNAGTAATGTMQVTTGINVRGEASSDAVKVGALYEGMQVEVLENLDSGWSHIRYTAEGSTIEGYVMTQYLGAVQ